MWIERRGDKWLVRERKDGKKRTVYTTDAERDARHFSRMGRPFPVTSSEIAARLAESFGSSKSRAPKLSAYSYEVIANDSNIGQGSRDAYEATMRNHVEGSIIDIALDRLVDDPGLIRKFYANLTPTKQYAASGNGMRASVIRVLSKVFRQAVNDGLIPSSPLARSGVKRPSKRRAKPIQPMSIDEIEELAAPATSERNRLAILLAVRG